MANKQLESNYDYGKLAKQRMIWALKPILGVCIVVWVLHPATATNPDLNSVKLQSSLAGAVYGLVIFKDTLQGFLIKTVSKKTDQKNRVPEEYYMGHIEKTLRSKDEKEI